ncbi:hypothetical protein T459_00853 [Capsicum annuum]|uniref:Aquaporin TIP1-2 n=1 Tax=Capsicum annuum TaxID=4072 RepID=A0A2G3AFF2_CAPAN|nr:hypothetical protein T459_00853 [Capsicum annuum]
MFIFVFPSEGCAIALASTLTSDGTSTPGGGFITIVISHAFSLFVAISMSANISGGHVNLAITFGAFLGGHISLYKSILYWTAQFLGSVTALFLLKVATGDMECIAPISIGFVVAANNLGGGLLYGAAINPAMAFGQAVDSWKWNSHWIYWLGPFVGAAIAALVYETIFIDSQNAHEQVPAKRVEKEYLKEYLIQVE